MNPPLEELKFCWNRFLERPARGGASRRESLGRSLEKHFSRTPGYRPTRLFRLEDLARELGLGSILVKDESTRLAAGSFKILGTVWAVDRLFRENPRLQRDNVVLSAASEGNHGRAVARVAATFGLRCVIYLPEHVAFPRIEAIRREGAEIESVAGSYQDAVDRMIVDSAEKDYQVISDTGYAGYETIPAWVSEGYQLIFHEVEQEIAHNGWSPPDLVLLQGGVGTFASSGVGYYQVEGSAPKLVVVEPLEADCLLSSAFSQDGTLSSATGRLETRMSGLNCSLPSLTAWPVLRAGVDLFLAIHDDFATEARARLESPSGNDPPISTSESGSAGLAGLLALCLTASGAGLRERLQLDSKSTVLVVNTEGANDL